MEEEQSNLPTELAREPEEEACHPCVESMMSSQDSLRRKKIITFAEATQSTEGSSAHYKEVLSQPAPNLSQRQRLQWLQKRRAPGLWVQCDECNRWRYLPHILDNHELPAKWYCHMNPDTSVAKCSVPEVPICVQDEEDLIHGEYAAGSLVWARMPGWPWWPAMVDDDPDTEQYYWLDGFSDIPTYYNVVFFDAFDVSRAWIAPKNLKPFKTNKKSLRHVLKDKRYRRRMEVAVTQAEDADTLPLQQRLAKYSFISRFPGAINKPNKVAKHELIKFQNQIKRKYNIAFPDESAEESEGDDVCMIEKRESSKNKNMILLGTPKSSKEIKSRITEKEPDLVTDNAYKPVQDSLVVITVSDDINIEENNKNKCQDSAKETNDSTAVQVGSTVTSTVVDESPENDTSKTYVPESEANTEEIFCRSTVQNIEVRIASASPNSDDFDFNV